MTEVIIKFQLPEDETDLEMARSAPSVYSFLHEFEEMFLRTNIKYGITEQFRCEVIKEADELIYDAAIQDVLRAVRSIYYDMKDEHGIVGV